MKTQSIASRNLGSIEEGGQSGSSVDVLTEHCRTRVVGSGSDRPEKAFRGDSGKGSASKDNAGEKQHTSCRLFQPVWLKFITAGENGER